MVGCQGSNMRSNKNTHTHTHPNTHKHTLTQTLTQTHRTPLALCHLCLSSTCFHSRYNQSKTACWARPTDRPQPSDFLSHTIIVQTLYIYTHCVLDYKLALCLYFPIPTNLLIWKYKCSSARTILDGRWLTLGAVPLVGWTWESFRIKVDKSENIWYFMINSQRFKPVYKQKVRSPEEYFLIAQSTERISTEIVSWRRDKSSAVKIGSVSDSG